MEGPLAHAGTLRVNYRMMALELKDHKELELLSTMASKCRVEAEVTAKRKVMSKQRGEGGKPTQRKGGRWLWPTPIVEEDSLLSDLVRFSTRPAALYFLSLDVQSLPLYIFKYAPFHLV